MLENNGSNFSVRLLSTTSGAGADFYNLFIFASPTAGELFIQRQGSAGFANLAHVVLSTPLPVNEFITYSLVLSNNTLRALTNGVEIASAIDTSYAIFDRVDLHEDGLLANKLAFDSVVFTQFVPEPSVAALALVGAVGCRLWRRKKME